MSLEQAILDRLEKRNGQIEMLQQTIQAMSRAADAEREHARQQLGPLIEENKKLAAQVDSEVTERRERLIKSLNDEITKRDHELRAHEKELAEQREEIRKLRAEVPLESTREGLKNAVAQLQEETKRADKNQVKANALDSIREFAETCGMMSDETVNGFIERKRVELEEVRLDFKDEESQVDTLERQADGLRAEMNSLANQLMDAKAEASGIRGLASSWGCREGETVTAFIQRISMGLAEAKTDLAETIAGLNAKVAELEAQAGKIGYVAKGEHEEAVTAARENGIHKGESLSGFIWRQCEGLRKSQAENAPLTKLFVVLCKQRGNLNEEIIYRAVDEASNAIRQLTA